MLEGAQLELLGQAAQQQRQTRFGLREWFAETEEYIALKSGECR